jgi:hypothetical protein
MLSASPGDRKRLRRSFSTGSEVFVTPNLMEEIFHTTEALKQELDDLYKRYGLRENWREKNRQ